MILNRQFPILFFVFLFTSCIGNAQFLLPKEKIKEDLNELKLLLRSNHPNAQSHDFEEQFDAQLATLTIKSSSTMQEAYQLFSSFLPLLEDGHTTLNRSKGTWSSCLRKPYFPLLVHLHGTDLFLIKNLKTPGDTLLTQGSKLKSINGIPTQQLITEMISYLTRDGNNLNYPIWIINNFFYYYYAEFYGCEASYNFEFENKQGQIENVRINGVSGNMYIIEQEGKKKTGVNLSLEGNTGLLSIYSWSNKIVRQEFNQKLKQELKTSFERIINSKIDHLIIDLRDNQGGNINQSILALSYLLNQPYQLAISAKRIVRKELNGAKRIPITKMNRPRNKRFTGQIYVLINGGCFSNSILFCNALRKHNRAVFIGEETGGSTYTLCFETKQFSLTNSKILVKIPTIKAILQSSEGDISHGVLPDYEVKPSIEDLIQLKDPVMQFTIDLINKQSAK